LAFKLTNICIKYNIVILNNKYYYYNNQNAILFYFPGIVFSAYLDNTSVLKVNPINTDLYCYHIDYLTYRKWKTT